MADKKTRILIVDDHPAMRHALAQLISREEDLVVLAETGSREETLGVLSRKQPDMAIVDIALQEGKPSGLDLITDIRNSAGPIPVLVLSMYDKSIYMTRAFNAGAMGYLSKEAPVDEILIALRALLNRECYFPRGFVLPPRISCSEETDALSRREFEVFRLVGQGFPAREIADSLSVSVKTVETHKSNIKKKLRCDSMSEMVRFAVRWQREEGESLDPR